MNGKLIKNLLTAVIASAAAVGTIISASAYELERHSQAEIKEMYKKLYFDIHHVSEYTEPYSTQSPGTPGKISDDTLEEGLNSINFCRYLAGLPYDVELDDEYNVAAQHASLIIYMNNELNHHPSKPKAMGDDVFKIAYKASGESNIGKGYMDIQAAVVQGYMYDTDKVNLPVLGHRRWILNPDMQKTGLGMVYDSTAMYVRDKTREDKFTGDYICWPPTNMPYELMYGDDTGYAYSVTLNSSYKRPERNEVKVTVTSKLLNKTWVFDKTSGNNSEVPVGFFNVNQENTGIGNCIIFNPGKLPENDVVEVKVEGIYKNGVEAPITYKVNYFNMLDESDYKLGFPKKKYELEIGQSMLLQGYDNPLTNNGYCFWHYCDDDRDLEEFVDIMKSGGSAFITGKKEGVIDFWIGNTDEWFDDVYTTVTVTHKHERGGWIIDKVPTETEPGSRYHKCTICGKEIDREVMPATSVEVADIQLTEDKYIYNGSAIVPKIKVYSGEKRLTEGTDYLVTCENNVKVGTAKLTVTGMGYFGGSKTVDFNIVKRDPVALSQLDVTFKGEGLIYTGKAIEPKLIIKEGSYTLEKDTDYTVAYENNTAAGKGKVTIKGQGDYMGTLTYNFDIAPADIGYPWTTDNLGDVKYSGKPIMLRLKLKSQVSGEELIDDVDYTVNYENNLQVGTATITVTGKGNYSGTTTNTFNIVSAEDYTGPEERDDIIEIASTASIVIGGGDTADTNVTFISADGVVYKVVAAYDGAFYADLPEGEYVVWIVKKSCMPVCTNITVGSVFASVDVNVYQYGDINRDGKLNVSDTSLSAAFTKGKRAPDSEEQRQLADVTRDGILNVTDTSKLAAHAKGIRVLTVEEEFEIPVPETKSEESSEETSENEEAAYETVKKDYLAEFNVEWGDKSKGMPGSAMLDLDGDDVDELFIDGSYTLNTPDRLYAFVDGKAVLLKESRPSEDSYIVLTNKNGEVYLQTAKDGDVYFEVYKYEKGVLTLTEKLVYSESADDKKDHGDFTLIDKARYDELQAGQLTFD